MKTTSARSRSKRRRAEGVQLWTAPQEKFSDIEDLDDDEAAPVYELVKDGNVTQTDEVAINDVNDVVIVQVQASGLEGLLTTNGDISTAAYGLASEQVDDDDNSGVFSLTFENADPGANQDSPQQDIDQLTNYKVIYDEANDTHFVAVDSSDFESELVQRMKTSTSRTSPSTTMATATATPATLPTLALPVPVTSMTKTTAV
ncbi:hypothetical protein ACFQH8_15395 [Halomicroarcula sp. GCM10025710]